RLPEYACSCGLYLALDDDRQRECKGRTLARLRLDPNPSAVHLNDALGDGQSQAGAALLAGDGIVSLLELLKQLGLIGSGDAGSGVTDRYTERAIVRFGLDGAFAGISELNRITDKIDQDLRQSSAITTTRWQLRSDLDVLLVGLRQAVRRRDVKESIHSRSGNICYLGITQTGRRLNQ